MSIGPVPPTHGRSRATPWVLTEVNRERREQQAQGTGTEVLPDGSSDPSWVAEVAEQRVYVTASRSAGTLTWHDLLRWRAGEVLATTDVDALRAQLIRLAAWCVAWVEAIDARRGTTHPPFPFAAPHQADQPADQRHEETR